jgi:hypothetical protein
MSALSIRIGRGASRLPAEIALSLIPSLPRPALERLVQRLIDGLDDMDPDSDLEPNGDELDGGTAEDDFIHHGENWKQEPGCPVSDPGGYAIGEGYDPRLLPPPTYDGEDQNIIILPAPKGIEPTRYRIS